MSKTHDLSVTRLIDAPVAQVWTLMTERMAEWWCPRPWTTEIVEQDWRAGGRAAMTVHGPDGERHDLDGVFLEVVEGERFTTTDAFTAGWLPQTPFMTGIWALADEAGKTRYTATARHWSAEAKAQHETMGFAEGWGTCAAQLAKIAEREAS